MKVFIIPATFNEKENIGEFVTVIEEEVFPKIKHHDLHIIVADDNSPDGTADEVRKLMKKYKNLEVNTGERKGLGAAYLRVMSYAIEKKAADVVISIDADFQFDPHDIPKFIEKIDNGYDMVVQTRYSNGGSIPENWPVQRKLFSIVANNFVKTVFGKFDLHDWTGGFRAIKKDVFTSVAPKLVGYNGYIFQIAFLHKAMRSGYKIGEVPLHFSDRKLGNSKIAPLDYILDILQFVLLTRFHELERFIKFLFVGGTGFLIQIFIQEGAVKLGVPNPTAVALGAESAIISNFMLNNFWTFRDTSKIKERDSFFVRLVKFNIASIGAIVIQFLADFIAEMIFGPTMTFANITLPTRIVILFPTIIFLVIPLNYLIYNRIIWKTQHLNKQKLARTNA